MTTLRSGELFAGAGGLSLGFILADHDKVDFQPIFAIDNDKHSINTYKTNMAWLSNRVPDTLAQIPHIFKRDVERLNVKALLRLTKLKRCDLDILIGGPPCQGFSSSNRRSSNKQERNKLVNVFLNRLEEFQPKMFLMENVQGLRWTEPTDDMAVLSSQEALFPEYEIEPSNVQEFLVRKARSLGYNVWFDVLDAVDFGVPQHRLRFFLFGIRSDIIPETTTVTLTPYLRKVKEIFTVFNAIKDLPVLENGQNWADENYYPDKNKYVEKMRRFMDNRDLYDHFTTKHADYVIERYKHIPEGGNWESIKDQMTNYKKVENTHSNIYKRLSRDNPAHTISHYRKSMIVHPTQDRGLSFREACRLQSFPDWFRFHGTLDEKQQQLGNAVPPLMASAIAWAIGEFWSNIVQIKKSAVPEDGSYTNNDPHSNVELETHFGERVAMM